MVVMYQYMFGYMFGPAGPGVASASGNSPEMAKARRMTSPVPAGV